MTATKQWLPAAVPEFFPDLRLMNRFNEKPHWLHHSFNGLQITLQLKQNTSTCHTRLFDITVNERQVRKIQSLQVAEITERRK